MKQMTVKSDFSQNLKIGKGLGKLSKERLQAKIGAVKTRGFMGEWSSSRVALWSGGLRKVKLDASLRA
ncbi:hypothetical protein F2Q70_00013956 [Brassica cretica]|uniref:Uncharacterized protein n=1 Tax=Brassica cretica TaxID=69181 RepID=A0A8S9HZW8_BRACR|nr:hypothetical protein F2Q70_00013956 [Brassica cretica]